MLGDRAKNRSIASNDAGSLPTAKTNAILKKQAAAKLYLEQKAVYNLIKRSNDTISVNQGGEVSNPTCCSDPQRCKTQVLDL